MEGYKCPVSLHDQLPVTTARTLDFPQPHWYQAPMYASVPSSPSVAAEAASRHPRFRPAVMALGAVAAAWLAGPSAAAEPAATATPTDDRLESRCHGLLLGSAVGDALGGPVEFQPPSSVAHLTANCREWPAEQRLTRPLIAELAAQVRLHPYAPQRPETEPYGQWLNAAPAGTVTDDTRHKLILMFGLEQARQQQRLPLTEAGLAAAYLAFCEHPAIASRKPYQGLCEESLREYFLAARWILGERNSKLAAPPARIWGGLPTCSGQMTLPPIACIYPGRPDDAYRAAYALGFFDTGAAKDINSSIVAGLAVALDLPVPRTSEQRAGAWRKILAAMRTTDPFRYAASPYAQRPTTQWLDFAQQAVVQANGRPQKLYEILETRGEVRYYWEAHFIFAVAISTLEMCEYDPLAALQIALDFGHDTDSAAQLIGAFGGALEGLDLFPHHVRTTVEQQLAESYDASIDRWTTELTWWRQQAASKRVVDWD